jgi:hypothetical protein
MNGQMIAMADGTTPVFTYISSLVVCILEAGTAPPNKINKTTFIGLGHVIHQAEVITGAILAIRCYCCA